jgi:hypothetical protein
MSDRKLERPLIPRVAARHALATHVTEDSDGKQSLEILAMGTKLLRARAPTSAAHADTSADGFRSSLSSIGFAATSNIRASQANVLPTTLEAAVASANQSQHTGALPGRSSQVGSDQSGHLEILGMDNAVAFPSNDEVLMSTLGLGHNSRWAMDVQPALNSSAMSSEYEPQAGLGNEFDFDACRWLTPIGRR